MKKVLILFGVSVLLASCGSSGGSGGVSDMTKLPRMTSPIITSSVSGSSVKVSAATTGLTFWGTTSSAFNSTSSRGMCEMFNLSRDSLSKAAHSDQILCYIQNTVASAVNKAAMDASGINIYDGNYHVVSLSFVGGTPSGSANTAPKMKFKIVKSGDSITAFEMFMCMGGTTASPAQTEYQHQTIDGSGNVAINNKEAQADSQGGFWYGDLKATGKLNSDAKFTEKTITTLTNWYVDGSNYNYQKAVFNQFSDKLKVSAAQVGKCGSSCGGDGSEYGTYAYSEYQLLNGTSTDIHTLAMGDGSLRSNFTMGPASPESWNGDTKVDLADWTTGDNYSAVNATAVPSTNPGTEAQALAAAPFATSETWDCSDAATATMIVDQDALASVCSDMSLEPDNGNNWIDCYSVIGH